MVKVYLMVYFLLIIAVCQMRIPDTTKTILTDPADINIRSTQLTNSRPEVYIRQGILLQ